MLRPLDQALFDFERAYRQNFKDPLPEHELYTKIQLIYTYGYIGSEHIKQVNDHFNKNKQQNLEKSQFDIEKYIREWNEYPQKNKMNRSETKIQESFINKSKIQYFNIIEQKSKQIECDQQKADLRRTVQELKREPLVTSNQHQRKHKYRRQLQVLFKLRRVGHVSDLSIRNHLGQLKPFYIVPKKPRKTQSTMKYEPEQQLRRQYSNNQQRYSNINTQIYAYKRGNEDYQHPKNNSIQRNQNYERSNYYSPAERGDSMRDREREKQRERQRQREKSSQDYEYKKSHNYHRNRSPYNERENSVQRNQRSHHNRQKPLNDYQKKNNNLQYNNTQRRNY